jgi:hypothetical protein
MDLSFWLTTASLGGLAYAAATWLNGAYIAPLMAARATKSVKSKRRISGFKKSSARSQGSEPVNVGSAQQDATPEPVQVQPSVQRSALVFSPAGENTRADSADGAFTLTSAELMQLTEAINQRREGATVEEAVCTAFGVKKGGSEGYRRAKAIWDAATAAPGAAPAGTYTPLAAPAKRRRRAAR